MKLLLTGCRGQVGAELALRLPALGEVIALDRQQCDLSLPETLTALLNDFRPDVIVNAAAYTAVDRAETEAALANTVNGEAVAVLAEWSRKHRRLLVHYSTDYVFDGAKDGAYLEGDKPNPLNAYGASKLLGEQALAEISADYLCLRTSWVYAANGRNFVNTLLRLAQQQPLLRVVVDQHGAPTWAGDIAEATVRMIRHRLYPEGKCHAGIYHVTNQGDISWRDFAVMIVAAARRRCLPVTAETVESMAAADYPSGVRRPANSRLDNARLQRDFGIRLPTVEAAFAAMLQQHPLFRQH